MRTRAQGPYIFLGYRNDSCLPATLRDPIGKEFSCSVANLLPMRTLTCPARLVALEAEHVHVFPIIGDEMELESVLESEELLDVVQRGCKWSQQWEPDWDRNFWPDDGADSAAGVASVCVCPTLLAVFGVCQRGLCKCTDS